MKRLRIIKYYLFLSLCGVCLTVFGSEKQNKFDSIINLVSQGGISVSDLPGIGQLNIPSAVRDLLGSISLSGADVTFVDSGISIAADAKFAGTVLKTEIIVKQSLSDSVNISIIVSVPDGWKLSNLLPELGRLDPFSFSKTNLIIANYEYHDDIRNVKIKEGANLFGTLILGGPLQYLTYLIGENLNQINLVGLIVPDVYGSCFSARLPGRVDFIGGLTATDLSFAVEIEKPKPGALLPSGQLETSITIDFPDQKPLIFTTTIGMLADKAELTGAMEGMIKNIFGIYGVHAGGWSLGGSVGYTSLLELLGLIPLTSFSMGFDLIVGDREISMESKIGFDSSNIGDIAFEGTLKKDLSLDDCINLVGGIIEETPFYTETVKEYQELVEGYMPNFTLGDVRVFFSPTNGQFGDLPYTKGLVVDGKGRLFGSDAQLMVDIHKSGMKIFAYIEELDFGPIKITGAGPDRIMDTPDDGLILDAELSLEEQYCYASGAVKIDIFGGIYTETNIDISSSGIAFSTEKKLFDLFDCSMTFSAELNKYCMPVDFYVRGHLHQTALSSLQQLLSKTAHRMAKIKMRKYHEMCKKGVITDTLAGLYNGFWNLLGSIIGNTFNIQQFTFEASVDELVGHTKLPCVTIKGIVLGKEFELTDIAFDMSDPVASAKEIIEAVSSLF